MQNKRIPIELFQMPFGKWKGSRLGDLYYSNKEYLLWCATNIKNNVVGDRIREFLDKMNNYEKEMIQPELDFYENEINMDPEYSEDIPF